VTLPWIIGSAVLGVLAGPPIRSCVVFYVSASQGTESGQPPRRACPDCTQPVLSARRQWGSPLPVTGRCPACGASIGPYPLVTELVTGLAMALVAARAGSAWELAALACLVLLGVPLALIDGAVHRLPNPLTAAAFAGVLAFLAVAALTADRPGELGRTAIRAAVLSCFYLLLWIIRPSGMGLGDVKLSASIGLVLGWISWQALFAGTFLAFILAAACGVVLLATRKAGRGSQLPLGPFMLLGALAAVAFLSL
jgi:leader peptidase (prepilin peptidase)/N-methyltransferase